MKKLAVFDLDGTFFRWQLYHELVFEMKTRGYFTHEEADALGTTLLDWQAKRRSWHEYEQVVLDVFEPKIAMYSLDEFAAMAQTIVERSGHKIYSYTRQLHDSLQTNGYFTLALSGSQQEIAEIFSRQYGFDDCVGSLYERGETTYTGAILRGVVGRKHTLIHEYIETHPALGLTLVDSVAIGDSSGDISMLELVDRPIAFNPDQALFEAATKNGWQIVIERKSLAYTLEKGTDGALILAQTDRF